MCLYACFVWTHGKHVVALHVSGVLVVTLVVKLPEEVERHHGVEIHHDRQQAHREGQLTDTHVIRKGIKGRWALMRFFAWGKPPHITPAPWEQTSHARKLQIWAHTKTDGWRLKDRLTNRHADPNTPVSRCVWQRRGWYEESWSPWRCPTGGQRRRSCYNDPERTWPCTRPSTRRTARPDTGGHTLIKRGNIDYRGR